MAPPRQCLLLEKTALELLRKILCYAVLQDGTTLIPDGFWHSADNMLDEPKTAHQTFLSLALTCERISREVRDIYYKKSRFEICIGELDFSPLEAYLVKLSTANAQMIRSITIDLDNDGVISAAALALLHEQLLHPTCDVRFTRASQISKTTFTQAYALSRQFRAVGSGWPEIVRSLRFGFPRSYQLLDTKAARHFESIAYTDLLR